MTGETLSRDFPTTPDAVQRTPPGYTNIYVARLSADGASLDYATYLGGSREDDGGGIAVDAHDNAFITGRTNSRDFPTTPHAVQGRYPGGRWGDIVVARIALPVRSRS